VKRRLWGGATTALLESAARIVTVLFLRFLAPTGTELRKQHRLYRNRVRTS
jgi:hypothetical protein